MKPLRGGHLKHDHSNFMTSIGGNSRQGRTIDAGSIENIAPPSEVRFSNVSNHEIEPEIDD